MKIQPIYDRAPIWVQNSAISILGIRARWQRYGGHSQDLLRQLRGHETYSAEQLSTYQTRRLRDLMKHALTAVPYYRTLHELQDIDPHRLDVSDLPKLLPVLGKDVVRSDPTQFHADRLLDSRLTTIHTSGTSSSPLPVRVNLSAIRANYAFFSRFLGWHGTAPLDSSITLAGRLIVPPLQVGPPFHRFNRGLNDVLLSAYRISSATKNEYRRVIENVSPSYIDAYPSALYSIAELLRDAPPRVRKPPKVIVTSSETLLDNQRQTIQQVFGCPVRDQYGSAEVSVFACECEKGSLHLNSDYGIFELLRTDGSPAHPGEVGRIVVTGFWNEAMPLIRYEIGDSGIIDDKQCPCGRAFPVIRELVGRTDDVIRTPSGRLVGRLDPAFKNMPGLKEAQIIQTATNSITVKVVVSDCELDVVERTLRQNLAARLEPSMTIHVNQVESIPRSKSGKFQSVLSLLPKDAT